MENNISNVELKVCNTCHLEKPVTKFYKQSRNVGGFHHSCIECYLAECKRHSHTKKGVIAKIYGKQKRSSVKRNHQPPNYTLDELMSWCFNQLVFHELYLKWKLSEYKTSLRPSIDRLDDYKGYSFDNIQLVTWEENRVKYLEDKKNGINNKVSKAVLQYTQNHILVEEHYSMRSAARKTGINMAGIWGSCKNKISHSGGFIWEYKNNN